MPEKTVMKYLEDIRDYSQKAIDYLNNITYEEFLKDNKTIDAAIRTIEVVGEAATKIKNMPNSSDIFEKYNYVDWKEAVRMRNRIIHGYEDIDLEIVWNTVKTDFPKLKNNIEKVIKEVKEQINPTPVEKEPVQNKPEIKPTQEIKRKFRR
ncbi:MAG: DUF86 domain-containing protein [Deltaproteobacteria bacterium]|jgi:uncharacterized protein with HEPN domain|nr:DUF86 domain-containing protein [Deltaproteobacteria bacterium]